MCYVLAIASLQLGLKLLSPLRTTSRRLAVEAYTLGIVLL
jgi:hypothetical protein